MKSSAFLTLVCLAIALSGCARPTAQISTPTVLSASPNPSRTATLLATKTAPPLPTLTSRTLLPTPTPAPLSQTGPWLMVYNAIDTGRGFDPDLLTSPIFTNADGSAWEPANLPYDSALDQPEPRRWTSEVDPKGPYIALREDMDLTDFNFQPYSPTCDSNVVYRPHENGRYNMLYILKLPENKIVNQFRLFGDKAIAQFRKEECAYTKKGSEELPPVLGTILSSWNLHWSPDGRYLVFTAAPDDPSADLYLYDTRTNSFRQLTSLHNNPLFISWKPDGSILLYHSMTKMSDDPYVPWKNGGLRAVSLAGADRPLTNSFRDFDGWYSPTQFLMDDGYCDRRLDGHCTTNIRLVNLPDISTASNQVIYSNPRQYYEFGVDSQHQAIIVWGTSVQMFEKGKTAATPTVGYTLKSDLDGVYQFDLTTRAMTRLTDGGIAQWDPRFKAFQGFGSITTPSGVFYLRIEPGKGWVTEPDYLNIIDVSPDGQWSIREGKEQFELDIADKQGHPVQKIEGMGSYAFVSPFSPDSNVYAEMIHERGTTTARLILYAKQKNWQPTVVRTINTDQFWFCKWISPIGGE